MSTNHESIKIQIKSFNADAPVSDSAAPVASDPRVDAKLEAIRAKVAAQDVEQREKWEANVEKPARRKMTVAQVTPDWYETGPIKQAKPGIPQIKNRSGQHPYPGRRTIKPKSS